VRKIITGKIKFASATTVNWSCSASVFDLTRALDWF